MTASFVRGTHLPVGIVLVATILSMMLLLVLIAFVYDMVVNEFVMGEDLKLTSLMAVSKPPLELEGQNGTNLGQVEFSPTKQETYKERQQDKQGFYLNPQVQPTPNLRLNLPSPFPSSFHTAESKTQTPFPSSFDVKPPTQVPILSTSTPTLKQNTTHPTSMSPTTTSPTAISTPKPTRPTSTPTNYDPSPPTSAPLQELYNWLERQTTVIMQRWSPGNSSHIFLSNFTLFTESFNFLHFAQRLTSIRNNKQNQTFVLASSGGSSTSGTFSFTPLLGTWFHQSAKVNTEVRNGGISDFDELDGSTCIDEFLGASDLLIWEYAMNAKFIPRGRWGFPTWFNQDQYRFETTESFVRNVLNSDKRPRLALFFLHIWSITMDYVPQERKFRIPRESVIPGNRVMQFYQNWTSMASLDAGGALEGLQLFDYKADITRDNHHPNEFVYSLIRDGLIFMVAKAWLTGLRVMMNSATPLFPTVPTTSPVVNQPGWSIPFDAQRLRGSCFSQFQPQFGSEIALLPTRCSHSKTKGEIFSCFGNAGRNAYRPWRSDQTFAFYIDMCEQQHVQNSTFLLPRNNSKISTGFCMLKPPAPFQKMYKYLGLVSRQNSANVRVFYDGLEITEPMPAHLAHTTFFQDGRNTSFPRFTMTRIFPLESDLSPNRQDKLQQAISRARFAGMLDAKQRCDHIIELCYPNDKTEADIIEVFWEAI